ncbi:hypothetical protein Pmani_005120 [Petrolisthes manimaculis]|uniref:Uncharacterized protein n=1 Tax=Petrolisthes manimaculis TaxID=1843537 RepID=A0AAE1QDI9_9EUCA|nr:hypothetical protein Pmani_005120 [Petrolisthes manimaculis]
MWVVVQPVSEGGDPEYCDAKFDGLKLFDGEIEAERSAGFLKHYQAKRKHFAKNGGSYDHRAFQMHYLDQAYSKYKRDHRPINKYIKRQLVKRLKIEGVARQKEKRAQRKILRELERVEIKRKKTIITKLENSSEASMCYKIKGRIYLRLATLDPELMLKDITTEDFVKGLGSRYSRQIPPTVIPEAIYTVSEEEAVAMIRPHYHYDDSDSNGRYSKELKGLKERIEEKMRQEEEHKAR